MTDVIHGRQRACICEKNEPLHFPHCLIMERSINWPKDMSSIYKIRDKETWDSYAIVISCHFQSAGSSTLALTRSQNCKKVMWGQVIQTDLVTWPCYLGGHHLHIICKENTEMFMPNFAALHAGVFPLYVKNLRVDGYCPRPVRGFSGKCDLTLNYFWQ